MPKEAAADQNAKLDLKAHNLSKSFRESKKERMFTPFKRMKGSFGCQPDQAGCGEENIPERGDKNMS